MKTAVRIVLPLAVIAALALTGPQADARSFTQIGHACTTRACDPYVSVRLHAVHTRSGIALTAPVSCKVYADHPAAVHITRCRFFARFSTSRFIDTGADFTWHGKHFWFRFDLRETSAGIRCRERGNEPVKFTFFCNP